MRLERVRIEQYRSAKNLVIPDIGALNVLIGKNNSGKSTILSSIDVFFRCIRGGRLVSIGPPLGKSIDFSDRQLAEPIVFALTFSLLTSERDALVSDLAKEAPQVKTATEGLDPSLWLEATLCVTPEPENYSYIESFHLVGSSINTSAPTKRLLFDVSPQAAKELAQRQRTIQNSTANAEAVNRTIGSFEEEDFARLKRDTRTEPSSFFRYSLRRASGELPAPVIEALDQMFRETSSYSDFRTKLTAFRDQLVEEGRKAERESLNNTIDTFSGQQSSVPAYVMNLTRRISEIKVLYLTERREQVGRAEAKQLLSFKVTRGGPEKLRNIQQTISGLLGVQVDAFESTSISPTGDRTAEMDVDNFLLEVNGSGIKEALRLILDVEFKAPSLLLVEEPEVHLHPALETNMMRYLKGISQYCQVFISTHSTNFVDTVEMQNVYFVSKPQGTTEVQLLSVEQAESMLPKELGIRLSSLFMFDRLVFVEGPTDEAIIREWASTLNVNLSQANVGFISMGGVRNFAHHANETIFNFLTKRQVLIWFIIDRDERDATDVASIQGKLQGKARVEVLARREIENYLLAPHAIEEFIKLKQAMLPPGKYPEVDQAVIAKALEECAEALKDQAIGKRIVKRVCTPIYPSLKWNPENRVENAATLLSEEFDRLRKQLQEVEQKAGEVLENTIREIDQGWGGSKLRLVPGDILLDHICQRFGVRFKKETDGQRLAALMKEHEIDPEIKDLIRSLASQ